jgi:hypothetical protein
MTRRKGRLVVFLLALAASGCGGGGVDAEYGRVRGRSLNGTGALVQLFREHGHSVRVTTRLSQDVGDWSETIVRFAPLPGPIAQKEAEWYRDWLANGPDRMLIYVPRDFDAESEYWDHVLAHLPPGTTERFRQDAEKRRNATKFWVDELPASTKHAAASPDWFALVPNPKSPTTCTKLQGPWAEAVDAKSAAITKHQALKPQPGEEVLLSGDGEALAVHWENTSGGVVLVVANGSFLLNEPLAHRARRGLAQRVVEWAGEPPRNIAFVESRTPVENGQKRMGSLLWPFTIYPTGTVLGHWLAFMLLLCLSAAAILGRPRGDPPASEDRPVAHAEALGDLLRRNGDRGTADEILEHYQRWRHPRGKPRE